ncbi:ATP-grasp domain-containing protein [Akkermansiaceae bacterium]|nr:ATP-grasp domain-containing protein [Akkermansiaceae bacterium]
MKKRLLFTGGGGSASQSIFEQWSDRYELFFADASEDSFPPSIPINRRFRIPFANDKAFLTSLHEICISLKIDLLIPSVDEELVQLSNMHGVHGWPQILVPDMEFVSLMLDKKRCAEAIVASGLAAPRTLPLFRGSEIGFPLIAKPRIGRGSRGVMKLDNSEQIASYLALHGGDGDDYIAQELAVGDEYTCLVAADRSGCLRAVIPVHAFEKRGVTIRARTNCCPAVVEYIKEFQALFKPTGVYNIQCVLTNDQRVLPFEVNPRISTTFVLGIATGFDPVSMVFSDPESQDLFIPSSQFSLQRSWHTHIESLA